MADGGEGNCPHAEREDDFLSRAAAGDASAVDALLAAHRQQLCRMVQVRMDPRLASRVDASDIVQDALLEASRRLGDYLATRPMPFYAWLRKIAWQRLINVRQFHVQAQKRSVAEEQDVQLPDESVMQLASLIQAGSGSPSREAIQRETEERLRDALTRLDEKDREVLVLRYLEELSLDETAGVLGISTGAVSMRQLRALQRLRTLMGQSDG